MVLSILSFRLAHNFGQCELILLGKPTLISGQGRLLVIPHELLLLLAVVQSFRDEFSVRCWTLLRLDGIVGVANLDIVQV